MSWLWVALLAGAVLVLVAAEWPRLSRHLAVDSRERRSRARRKAKLRVVSSESDDFVASVKRDLDRLPTIEEQEPRR